MDETGAKAVSMTILGLVSMFFGLLPIWLGKRGLVGFSANEATRHRNAIITSCLLCFGGGVLLSTCLNHILPEVTNTLHFNTLITYS